VGAAPMRETPVVSGGDALFDFAEALELEMLRLDFAASR